MRSAVDRSKLDVDLGACAVNRCGMLCSAHARLAGSRNSAPTTTTTATLRYVALLGTLSWAACVGSAADSGQTAGPQSAPAAGASNGAAPVQAPGLAANSTSSGRAPHATVPAAGNGAGGAAGSGGEQTSTSARAGAGGAAPATGHSAAPQASAGAAAAQPAAAGSGALQTAGSSGTAQQAAGRPAPTAGSGGRGAQASRGPLTLMATDAEDLGGGFVAFPPGAQPPTNQSPGFQWTGVAPEAKSLALVFRDLSSPTPPVKWVLWNISPTQTMIPAHVSGSSAQPSEVPGASQLGSLGNQGYAGPCCADHEYEWIIYALDVAELPGTTGLSTAQINMSVIPAHTIEKSKPVMMRIKP